VASGAWNKQVGELGIRRDYTVKRAPRQNDNGKMKAGSLADRVNMARDWVSHPRRRVNRLSDEQFRRNVSGRSYDAVKT